MKKISRRVGRKIREKKYKAEEKLIRMHALELIRIFVKDIRKEPHRKWRLAR